MLSDALKLHDLGMNVIRLKKQDKTPAMDWKAQQSQRQSKADAEALFKEHDGNVGIVTGAVSGVVVLDIDDNKGGSASLVGTELPMTPHVRTGSGWHYYYKHPGRQLRNFAGKLKGVDLRADGGYVVAPPSIHPNGKQYSWNVSPEACAFAEMPGWLLDLCGDNDNAIRPKSETTAYGAAWLKECEVLADAAEGTRNDKLNTVACKAGSLIAGGQLDEAEAVNAMLDACRRNGLMADGDKAVRDTIKSGLEAGFKRPRVPEVAIPKASTGLKLTRASSVAPEKIDWLWENVLAKGKPTIIGGDGGLGKSQIAINIAATVTTGGTWPGSTAKAEPGNVIYLSCEDGIADTIVPRLMAAGADMDRVFIVDGARDMKQDVPGLTDQIEEIGGCSLVIIDPISAYMGNAQINDSGDVRGITNELASFAVKHNLALLMLHHLNKNSDKSAAYRLIGSQAWQSAARMVYVVSRDGEDDERRLMSNAKTNIGKDGAAFYYRVADASVLDPKGQTIKTSRIEWEGGTHRMTADQALADRGDGGVASAEAKDFLRELLKGGRVLATKANKAAKDMEIAESTLKRAKKALGVKSVCEDDIWYWELPGGGANP